METTELNFMKTNLTLSNSSSTQIHHNKVDIPNNSLSPLSSFRPQKQYSDRKS